MTLKTIIFRNDLINAEKEFKLRERSVDFQTNLFVSQLEHIKLEKLKNTEKTTSFERTG